MRFVGLLLSVALAAVGAPVAEAGVVAFSSDRCPEAYREGCTPSLWTVRDDGTELTRITPPAHLAPSGEGSFDDAPSWSPDGRSLLYRRQLHSQLGHGLWLLSLDGGAKTQIGPQAPNERFDSYNEPEWSPEGSWITFSARPADAPRPGAGGPTQAIWLMSPDGAVVRRLTTGSPTDSEPTFSPDGRRIAYVRTRTSPDGPTDPSLLTMNLDGTGVAPILVGAPPTSRDPRFPGGALRISWSPDGRQLAIAFHEQLFTLRSDGTGLEARGSTGPPVAAGSAFSQLQWAAEPLPALIFSLPMQGSPLQRVELLGVPLPPRPLTPPLTSPDGRYVGGDEDPDWRASAPLPPLPDIDPPALLPIDLGAPPSTLARASKSRALSVRKSRLSFLAIDASGVRRVQAAVQPPSGASAARRWVTLRGPRGLARLVRKLRPGRYRLLMRAYDGVGNRSSRPVSVRVRLLR